MLKTGPSDAVIIVPVRNKLILAISTITAQIPFSHDNCYLPNKEPIAINAHTAATIGAITAGINGNYPQMCVVIAITHVPGVVKPLCACSMDD